MGTIQHMLSRCPTGRWPEKFGERSIVASFCAESLPGPGAYERHVSSPSSVAQSPWLRSAVASHCPNCVSMSLQRRSSNGRNKSWCSAEDLASRCSSAPAAQRSLDRTVMHSTSAMALFDEQPSSGDLLGYMAALDQRIEGSRQALRRSREAALAYSTAANNMVGLSVSSNASVPLSPRRALRSSAHHFQGQDRSMSTSLPASMSCVTAACPVRSSDCEGLLSSPVWHRNESALSQVLSPAPPRDALHGLCGTSQPSSRQDSNSHAGSPRKGPVPRCRSPERSTCGCLVESGQVPHTPRSLRKGVASLDPTRYPSCKSKRWKVPRRPRSIPDARIPALPHFDSVEGFSVRQAESTPVKSISGLWRPYTPGSILACLAAVDALYGPPAVTAN